MRVCISPGTGRRDPLRVICEAYRLARSSVYVQGRPPQPVRAPQKRGPKTTWSDAEVVDRIRTVLATCPFPGEGYREVRARLAPRRLGPPNGNPAHDGTITTDRPDVMQGTDATRFSTEQDGWCWFFGAVDHGTNEVIGWQVGKLGDRWAALEPIRQGVRDAYGTFAKDVACGVRLRCDWGPHQIAAAWINEVKWLGITIAPSDVGEPECNGVAERFMRTLKEQCLSLHQFQSLDEARGVIAEFIARDNTQWLTERVGHRTPAQARADAQPLQAA